MAVKILGCENDYLIPARIEDAKPMLHAMRPGFYDDLRFFEKPVTLERQEKYLRRMTESEKDFLFCVMNNGLLIGTAGLHECDFESGNARIGTLIFDPEIQGRGHGAMAVQLIVHQAFDKMGLSKVYVNVLTDFPTTHAYYEWLKFKRECRLDREYLLRGELHDLLRLRIFAEEWRDIFETG